MSEMTVSGPYKYEGDMHPSFRIDSDDRIIASVYASDGDIDAAERLANRIVVALATLPGETREIDWGPPVGREIIDP